jgi:transposase
VEGKSRRDGESLDHESRTAHCWLDAQKKTLIAQERDAWSRAVFQVEITTVAAEDVIVIDESSTNVHLTPRMAWAPCGQRAYGSVPRNTPPNITLIASLTTSGIGPSLLLEGGVDTAAFVVYIEQVLAPTLRPGQIVLLDNLSVHKNRQVQAAIVACGCQLWFLPTYSPDLSPIELAFAKVKELVRQANARTHEALEDAIAAALDRVTATDARSFFKHCGYRLTPDWEQLLRTAL